MDLTRTKHALDRRLDRAQEAWRLSPREREVLSHLVRGWDNQAIAAHLECAVRTVEAHVTHLLAKAGATSRLELVARFWLGAAASARCDGCSCT